MGDTNTTLSFRINKEDVKYLLSALIGRIIKRNSDTVTEDVKQLSELLADRENYDVKEILTTMKSVVDSYQNIIDEINNTSDIVLALVPPKPIPLEALGVSFESPSDTEVLEDLPDLKEDSLGIDSGSE